MKLKQLALELQISDAEVLRLAVQLSIKNVGFKTIFSTEQVKAIKQEFAQNSRHQLQPAIEIPKSEPTNQVESDGAIEQSPEILAKSEKQELGIAEQKQTALSNAMAASENQQAHILETEIQQAADDGLRVGVVKELVRATKEREGAMLVRDAVFQKGQESRDRLNELFKDSAGDDFLTNSQLSSQTYAQTVQTGAATPLDAYAALKNLGVKL
jgi:hypothetical protein